MRVGFDECGASLLRFDVITKFKVNHTKMQEDVGMVDFGFVFVRLWQDLLE